MRLSTTSVVLVLAGFGCSSSDSPSVDSKCPSTETCSESVCPELCGDGGEVAIANCFHSPRSGADDPGNCNCYCEYEDRRPTCFADGLQGADFYSRWIETETECVDGRGLSEECGSVCEAECEWGFPPLELRCPVSGGTKVHCECLCAWCEVVGIY